MPRLSPGNFRPDGWPMPNLLRYRYIVRGLSFPPAMIVPTLLDVARTPANVRCSVGCACESWKTLPERVTVESTDNGVLGVTTPSSRTAAAVFTLPLDPGSWTSESARLYMFSALALRVSFGLNPGALASARIS